MTLATGNRLTSIPCTLTNSSLVFSDLYNSLPFRTVCTRMGKSPYTVLTPPVNVKSNECLSVFSNTTVNKENGCCDDDKDFFFFWDPLRLRSTFCCFGCFCCFFCDLSSLPRLLILSLDPRKKRDSRDTELGRFLRVVSGVPVDDLSLSLVSDRDLRAEVETEGEGTCPLDCVLDLPLRPSRC